MRFRNKKAMALWSKIQNDSHIDESGVDRNGNIYFLWLNGAVARYSRREFLMMAEKGQYPSYGL